MAVIVAAGLRHPPVPEWGKRPLLLFVQVLLIRGSNANTELPPRKPTGFVRRRVEGEPAPSLDTVTQSYTLNHLLIDTYGMRSKDENDDDDENCNCIELYLY